ncbi:transporter substrate-binding domain-containing protein [Micromonospora sp. WMMD1128]|uniref:transporter substrate-binding domain-containing protein n=1 Tax=Micromonospora sp. WMMD1128 TaxID=3015150 RepID=UPI00248B6DA0|nr:transporter substrate-binding domain-containing protein [Micromonospora sp. WMMD1128]WBB71315.1 transporter substrate-binding domain-containing protein [Micromonospora sp. WMMD1128]
MAVRALLAGTLLATLAGCSAPAATTPAPAARPPGAQTLAPAGEATPICSVRRSLPASATRPRRIIEREPQRLIAGVDPSDATMSHWNSANQQFEGFNIDLLLRVVKALWPKDDPRDRVEFVVVPPGQGAFQMLDKNQIDLVATSLTASCERAEQVIFSNDYLDSGQSVLVRARDGGPEFAGVEEMGGRRVCAARNTTSLDAIRRYRTAGGERLVPVAAEHSVDCLVMLRQGQVDGVSTDENILRGFAQMAPDTALVTKPPRRDQRYCDHNLSDECDWFTDEPHAFAFRLDDAELAAFVNYALALPETRREWLRAHGDWLADHPDAVRDPVTGARTPMMPSPGEPVTTWPPPRPAPAPTD